MYLVEGTMDNRVNGAGEIEPIERLLTATETLDEFIVVRTQDQFDTANVITEITKQLGRLFWNLRTPKEELPISSYTYGQFKKQFNKSADITVTRAFVEQLVCLPSLSASRAQAIVDRYPTPASLRKALLAEEDENRRSIVSSLKAGAPPRAIGVGPATSVLNAFMNDEKNAPLSDDS
jgi:crossover junction endonuclease MUS81